MTIEALKKGNELKSKLDELSFKLEDFAKNFDPSATVGTYLSQYEYDYEIPKDIAPIVIDEIRTILNKQINDIKRRIEEL